MSTPLQGTASAADAIVRVKYSHDAMIDELIRNPGIKQNDLAAMFGFSVPWVSRVLNSDAFNVRLAARKTEIIDPSILMSFEEKLKGMAAQSLDIVQDRLTKTPSFDNAMAALELSTRALGYGAKQQNVNVQQNFVVALPSKIASSAEWADKARTAGAEAGSHQLTLVEEVK